MKLGENDNLMSRLFLPSFMRIGQNMWIFYKWPMFWVSVRFEIANTVTSVQKEITSKRDKNLPIYNNSRFYSYVFSTFRFPNGIESSISPPAVFWKSIFDWKKRKKSPGSTNHTDLVWANSLECKGNFKRGQYTLVMPRSWLATNK